MIRPHCKRRNPDAAEIVMKLNDGMKMVPTLDIELL
jgi:hypothetical protein